MRNGTKLATWVTKEAKACFDAIARHQDLSSSALLKRLVTLPIQTTQGAGLGKIGNDPLPTRDSRLTVRLQPAASVNWRSRAIFPSPAATAPQSN